MDLIVMLKDSDCVITEVESYEIGDNIILCKKNKTIIKLIKESRISQRLSRNRNVKEANSNAAATLTNVLDKIPTNDGCSANSRKAKWSNNNVLPKMNIAKIANTHQLARLPMARHCCIRSLIL